jgi:hypothetical protein
MTIVDAKVFLTVDQALRLAFPECELERETLYLTETEMESSGDDAGEPISRAIVIRYVARRDGRTVGTGYFDTHRVRTLDETLLVVVSPNDTIARIEVISFSEPTDYLPRESWYRQFDGEDLDADLRLNRAIHTVSGATLTANATTAAARRILALHQVLAWREKER